MNLNSQFRVDAPFSPKGDQPKAIRELVNGIQQGYNDQTLLGVTGSGKSFCMAKIIEETNRPALIMSHNKTLTAQLYKEFDRFFPDNKVEYFVSFYDYYQPESYLPQTDTYIEKDSSINEEIEKLRLSATTSLLRRDDVVVVASVSAIYGLSAPDSFKKRIVEVEAGKQMRRKELLEGLVSIQYERNDTEFKQGLFQVNGDIVEIYPAYKDEAIRVEFFGDTVDEIKIVDPTTRNVNESKDEVVIYPASHFAPSKDKLETAIALIRSELKNQTEKLKKDGKELEAERLRSRTEYDIEMLREAGYVNGIENYARHLDGRDPGEAPYTLLDYFPDDFLTFLDESHRTLPQIRGMISGDRARKDKLVSNGFRLPSAYDNRPLTFDEFRKKTGQTIFTSATPGDFEKETSKHISELIVRPTGLVDPPIDVRPTQDQVDDLVDEVQSEIENDRRVLITTLTKRLSENLTDYLKTLEIDVEYLHSDVDTLDRVRILRNLRKGKFDVLIGINLLREGLDLPEVGLVAILDADQAGFLRSETMLIQTIGRCARNKSGRVILYGDEKTDAMQAAIDETRRRRKIQKEYNEQNNIEPETIKKEIGERQLVVGKDNDDKVNKIDRIIDEAENEQELIDKLIEKMEKAARRRDFELAAYIKDHLEDITGEDMTTPQNDG